MGKIDELRQLFAEWQKIKQDRGNFYGDGILDEDGWEKSSPKILYILKEVNERDRNVYSIAELLARGVREEKLNKGFGPTWGNVIRLTYGLTRMIFNYSQLPEYQAAKMDLLKCAVLNLKKTRGGASADRNQVEQAAKDDRILIKREIAIIDPDIIVCCGTYFVLHEQVFDKKTDITHLRSGNYCFKAFCGNKPYLFINHYHPNSRTMRPWDLFNSLIYSVLCAKEKQLLSEEIYSNVALKGPLS